LISGAPLQTDEESSLHEEEESLLVEGERLHRGQGNYLGEWERLRHGNEEEDKYVRVVEGQVTTVYHRTYVPMLLIGKRLTEASLGENVGKGIVYHNS
jgi:hypothetical protein